MFTRLNLYELLLLSLSSFTRFGHWLCPQTTRTNGIQYTIYIYDQSTDEIRSNVYQQLINANTHISWDIFKKYARCYILNLTKRITLSRKKMQTNTTKWISGVCSVHIEFFKSIRWNVTKSSKPLSIQWLKWTHEWMLSFFYYQNFVRHLQFLLGQYAQANSEATWIFLPLNNSFKLDEVSE